MATLDGERNKVRISRVLILVALTAACAVLLCGCASEVDKLREGGDIQGLLAYADRYPVSHEEHEAYLEAQKALVDMAPASIAPLVQAVRTYVVEYQRAYDAWYEAGHRAGGLVLDDPMTRKHQEQSIMAGRALAKIKEPSTAPVLVEALTAGSLGVNGTLATRAAFEEILVEFGTGAEGDLVEALNTERGNAPSAPSGDVWMLRHQAEASSKVLASLFKEDLPKLLGYLESENTAMMYYGLICLGRPETVEPLIQALERFGSSAMATDYLNSGNGELAAAASHWAKSHGYETKTFQTGPSDTTLWGSQ